MTRTLWTKILTPPSVALGLLLAPHSVSAAVCNRILTAGSDIQAAINSAAANSTICLQAGTYTPAATLVVNKPLTLQGCQGGVDPRPSKLTRRVPGGSRESKISGRGVLDTIVRITSNGVTLDGLEVFNGTGDLIDSPLSASALDPIAIRNCIVHAATGDEGIQLRNANHAVIERNYVFDTTGDAINLCCGSTYGVIRQNEARQIRSADAAIYIYSLVSGITALNHLVENNLVYDVLVNDAIKLGSKDGGDSLVQGATVRNNTVRDTQQDGISVYMSGVDVRNNEVYRSGSENGAIYVAFDVAGVEIDSNSIHDNGFTSDTRDTYGVRIGKGADHPTGVTVNYNCIVGNERGLYYNFTAGLSVLDATNNWWGSSSGPSGCTLCAGSGDSVSDNVNYSPALLAPPSTPTACGTIP